jgi:cell division septation protein DedD
VALAVLLLAVAGCGSSDSSLPVASSTEPSSPATSSPATPTPDPPSTEYAVIADINPFHDSCAGADFLNVAHELRWSLLSAGFKATIHPQSDYPTIQGGQWCVEVGRFSSEAQANTLVARLANATTSTGSFRAQVYPVGSAP